MNNLRKKVMPKYLILSGLILALGVIISLFVYSNSFAEENENDSQSTIEEVIDNTESFNEKSILHIYGKALDPNNNPIEGASVHNGYDQSPILAYTDSNGEFDIECEFDTSYYFNQLYIVKKSDNSPRIEYRKQIGEHITENYDCGAIKCPYTLGVHLSTNQQHYREMSQFGTWYFNGRPLNDFNGGGEGFLYYYNTNYEINGTTITVNADATSCSDATSYTYSFVPNSGYELKKYNITSDFYDPWPNMENVNGVSIFASSLYIDAVVDSFTPSVKHVVTFNGDGIEKVTADGAEIQTGTEVNDGAVIDVYAVETVGMITKIKMNGVFATRQTANADIAIVGSQEASVNISGEVREYTEQQDDEGLLKATSKLGDAIDQAYISFTQNSDGWTTSTYSDTDGNFSLDVVKGQAGTLTISKDGFETSNLSLSNEELSGDVDNLEIELIKSPEPTPTPDPENPGMSETVNSSAQTGDMNYQTIVMVFAFFVICSSFLILSIKKSNK